jgi:hypothetical protein
VDHKTKYIARGCKDCIGPQSIFETETFVVLVVVLGFVNALKLVNELVGWQHFQVAGVVDEFFRALDLLRLWDRLAQLPVSLAIQLIRLDEDSSILFSSVEEDKIGGNSLALLDLDDHTDFDVF